MSAMSPVLGVGSLTLFIHRDRGTAIIHRIGHSGTQIVSGERFKNLERLMSEAGPSRVRCMEYRILQIINSD